MGELQRAAILPPISRAAVYYGVRRDMNEQREFMPPLRTEEEEAAWQFSTMLEESMKQKDLRIAALEQKVKELEAWKEAALVRMMPNVARTWCRKGMMNCASYPEHCRACIDTYITAKAKEGE